LEMDLDRRARPLLGVVHAAGVLDDGALLSQTWARYQEVMRPKALGAWNLHRVTEDRSLDFFVLFSSVAAIFGAAGQANYAAANALLDGLAHHSAALGLPAATIGWGAWSEAGMATRQQRARTRRASLGFGEIGAGEGRRVLSCLIADKTVQRVVVPIHWSTLAQQFGDQVPPLVRRLVRRAPR